MKFETSSRVCVRTAPEKIGTITGKTRERAGRVRYEVDFGSQREYHAEHTLEPVAQHLDTFDLLEAGKYGNVVTLRSAITHTRLTGRLADVIYSMETSNTEFLPYQFKPVLNFLDSPSKGILIADEVGLGKTIEAGLIWTELRSRINASKLLVLCPAVLREKWQDELARRFGVKADICSAKELHQVLKRHHAGDIDEFAAIVSMQGARPPKRWEDDERIKTGSAELARYLSSLEPGQPIFDCVIIDEAHYLRNPMTQLYELAQLVREVAEHLLLLSATPIHLRSDDLFYLLSLIDSENFRYVQAFHDVLTANAPLIRLADDLRRQRLSHDEFHERLVACRSHRMLISNRQLKHLISNTPDDATLADPVQRERLANRIERVNLLARIVSRTRKRDVQEDRVVREPLAPTVTMTETERAFYEEVTNNVRRYCADGDLSEGFILTMPQRQMCSSIPAAFRAWRSKAALDDDDDWFVDEDDLDVEGKRRRKAGPLIRELSSSVANIASFEELRAGDSKYRVLVSRVKEYWKEYPEKKVILFSYYRETLRYLYERLSADGVACVIIMGGMRESKQATIEKFRDDDKARILLASEVASEGVDLQFSSFLINYDLPWNPMRVEQRIGRIDRIGQEADRIHIWNFFYSNTIDERIYKRLFMRLGIFRHAFGDIEAVLGEKIQELSYFLLSHDLTTEQEEQRIEQAGLAIARTAREQEELEEEAAHLAAHGDYVLNQVKAARQMRRYIDAESLWRYVRDALTQDFPGTDMIRVQDDPLTAEIGLSQNARVELQHFLELSKLQGKTRLVHSRTDARTRCVFSSKVNFATASHEVVNQHHPLVRFITGHLKDKTFHRLVAARVAPVDAPGIENGTYLVTTQRWSTSGARTLEKLVFKGIDLSSANELTGDQAESLINAAAQHGDEWAASRSKVDRDIAVDRYDALLNQLDDEFDQYAQEMKWENNDRVDQLIRTLTDKVESQIAQGESTIAELDSQGKTRTIPARRGKIRKLEEYRDMQQALYEKKRAISVEPDNVITVAIHVGAKE